MEMVYLRGVSTLRLRREACSGCRLCTAVCPRGVFGFRDGKAEILGKDRCIECGACALNCPDGALSVRAGVGCASGILNGMLGRKSACCVVEDGDGADGCR